jgi:hypothetical protein
MECRLGHVPLAQPAQRLNFLIEVAPGIGEEYRTVDPTDVPPVPRLAPLRAVAEVDEGDGACSSRT